MQDVNKLLAQLIARRTALAKQLDELDRQIEAAQMVLDMCDGSSGNDVDHCGSTALSIAHCSTQMEAVKILAQANEGVLRITQRARSSWPLG